MADLGSLVSKTTIRAVAEMNGINVDSMPDDIPSALAPDVEYRIREIVQEAKKFMKHAKRTRLTAADINSALRLRNVEPIYGYNTSEPVEFQKAPGAEDLYYLADSELDLTDVINAPLLKCPLEPTFTAHWLAVEGVQPRIPENPSQAQISKLQAGATGKKRKLPPSGATTATTTATTGPGNDQGSDIKGIVKHILSKELQLYYEKVTHSLKNGPYELREAAIDSMTYDAGLHELLPYFTQFIADQVTHNLRNTALLYALLRMVRALLVNPHVHIELYLHQLMPSLVTCLVGRRLSQSPTEDHWKLRDYAADTLALVCRKFGDTYSTLQPRLTKTLLHAFLDTSKPLTTHYGAVVGLTALGPLVVNLLILPNLNAYWQLLKVALKSENSLKAQEAKKVFDALAHAAGTFLHYHAKAEEKSWGEITPLPTPSDDGGAESATGASGNNTGASGGAGGKAKGKGRATRSSARGKDVKSGRERAEQLLPNIAISYDELSEIFGDALVPYMTNAGQGGQSVADLVL